MKYVKMLLITLLLFSSFASKTTVFADDSYVYNFHGETIPIVPPYAIERTIVKSDLVNLETGQNLQE